MAESIRFTGKRYINGEQKDVTYLATVQADGFCYFNDDVMYRCKEDGSLLQLFYFDKQIWVLTNNITDLKPEKFDVIEMLSNIAKMLAGGGGVSPNADVEKAVQWAIDKATNNYITYTQDSVGRNLKNPNGLSYDCSSFIITAFYVGGFDINASYTGNMRAGFTQAGFVWHPMSYIPANVLQRGDILLNEANHTQMYIGNNQDVNCGSTPARVCSHSNDYWGRGWDGFLRYGG